MGQFDQVQRLAKGETLNYRVEGATYADQIRRIAEAYGYSVRVSHFPERPPTRYLVLTAKPTERCEVDAEARFPWVEAVARLVPPVIAAVTVTTAFVLYIHGLAQVLATRVVP